MRPFRTFSSGGDGRYVVPVAFKDLPHSRLCTLDIVTNSFALSIPDYVSYAPWDMWLVVFGRVSLVFRLLCTSNNDLPFTLSRLLRNFFSSHMNRSEPDLCQTFSNNLLFSQHHNGGSSSLPCSLSVLIVLACFAEDNKNNDVSAQNQEI